MRYLPIYRPMSYLEVELKFLIIDNIQIFEDKLAALGFHKDYRSYEKTTMYDNVEWLMQTSNGRVRLRVNDHQSELCYKKPIYDDSGIKKEIEYETIVADPHATELILWAMDFGPVSSYERYRTYYRSETSKVKVTLDEYPFANYLELEWGEEGEIINLAESLWLDMKNNLTKPCDTLFNEWRKERGLVETMIMSFDDYSI